MANAARKIAKDMQHLLVFANASFIALHYRPHSKKNSSSSSFSQTFTNTLALAYQDSSSDLTCSSPLLTEQPQVGWEHASEISRVSNCRRLSERLEWLEHVGTYAALGGESKIQTPVLAGGSGSQGIQQHIDRTRLTQAMAVSTAY